jgi:nucleoside-diphosphate-sugar epimerase
MAFDKVARIDAGTRIVITGANGLVGQALLNRLQSTSARTVALIRYRTELPAKEIIPGPLTSGSAVDALKKADYVVHRAGAVSPFGKNSYQKANVETTEAVVMP